MKRLTILLTLLLILTTAMCPDGTQKVNRVIDGDTIVVDGGDTIRILGIDAYDSQSSRMINKQVERTGFSYEKVKGRGLLAKRFAKETLGNKCVELEADYRDRGRYGRLLRYVFVDGQDYQAILLDRQLGNAYCGDKKAYMYEYYNSISEFKCN